MSRLRKGLVLIAALALILSLAAYWKARRDLQAARRELMAVTTANEFLKKTLGDTMVAMAGKDREIDRLEQLSCDGEEKARPRVPPKPDHSTVSESNVVCLPETTLARLIHQ